MSYELCDEAPAAIALLSAGGAIERATSLFVDRYGAEDGSLAAHLGDVERLIAGHLGALELTLDGAEASASAVADADGRRYALVSVASHRDELSGDPTSGLFEEPLDDSPAIVWLKDLEGRYLRINRRYEEQLGTDAEQVVGRTDAELTPNESIEGLRARAAETAGQEPLELEYTVGAFDGRPAFAALRFALRDRDGQPTAVCGIAAPLAEAWTARSECERLMRIERWSRADTAAIRKELLDEWGLAPVEAILASPAGMPVSEGPSADGGLALITAIAAERDAALTTAEGLEQELAAEREQIAALRGELQAAADALGSEQELVESLNAELAVARDELEEHCARAEQAEREAAAAAAAPVPAGPRWGVSSQRSLSAAVAGVADWRAVLKQAVTTLGTEGGWDAAVAWCPDERRGLMRCVAMWTGAAAGLSEFETRTWQHRQDVSSAEFGRARNRLSATCLLELQTAEDPLLQAAAAEGMGSALLVPVRGETETIAMLELLSRTGGPPNAELIVSLEAVALQLAGIARLLKLAEQPHWRVGRL